MMEGRYEVACKRQRFGAVHRPRCIGLGVASLAPALGGALLQGKKGLVEMLLDQGVDVNLMCEEKQFVTATRLRTHEMLR
jgi:hypothetical protein